MTLVQQSVLDWIREAGLEPRKLQQKAIDEGLLDGANMMICSPTGSGKTLIGEMAALRAVSNGRKAVFMVPLKSLAIQIGSTIRERYSHRGLNVEVSTSDLEASGSKFATCDVLVSTYERTDSLLRHRADWLSDIGTVIVDEIQNISDPMRGGRLEGTLMRLRKAFPEVQFVVLSATIGQPKILAEWLDSKLLQSSHRPVPLVTRVLKTNEPEKTVRDIVMRSVQRNGQVVVFSRTRREAVASAKRLAPHVVRQLRHVEKDNLDTELDSVENWNASLPSELVPLVHQGVAYHHAGLDFQSRSLVERLFKKGFLKAISATTTLASGMNLPARTVVLSSIVSPADYKQILSANEVHQMLGRAGRPGFDKEGFGIIITRSEGERKTALDAYFQCIDASEGEDEMMPRFSSVRSSLSSNLTEQVLVAIDFLDGSTVLDLEDVYFAQSYLVHNHVRNPRSPVRPLILADLTAQASIEQHALSETLHAAMEGVLAHVDIREKSEETIGGLVKPRSGGGYTCRFSIRSRKSGVLEGPSCSCGKAIGQDGILCPHLVALGIEAAKSLRSKADFIIPLALGETSPVATLTKLGLIEGGSDARLRLTALGSVVCKLYLHISTVREILALLPMVDTSRELLDLIAHIIMLESGRNLGESTAQIVAELILASENCETIATRNNLGTGDIRLILDMLEWILISISSIAEVSNLDKVGRGVHRLLNELHSNRYNAGDKDVSK
ncbi:MAG: DEAD/DEAH box helicase [Candidatus Thorarchaeota archaeon]